ncbi:NADH:ubiquinone oxidoreductase, partial [Pseudomonas aeruginosa]
PGLALAEACNVHSVGLYLDVMVCQQNRSIPAKLFREGICQPQLQGQKVEVTFAEESPTGAFGVCGDAWVPNARYRQEIF